jgi:FMN reductase [NAD(P)H]
MIAARSLGLGVVPIGGIRRNSPALIDLLELPQLTFPIVGVTIGHVRRSATIKPRLARETFRHDEHYDSTGFADAFVRYDSELMAYWRKIGRTDGLAWTENTASHYAAGAPIRPTLADAARQGLLNNK